MEEVNTDPLASLRQRWEIEKSPKLTLQLAEEHGRRREHTAAIEVLRAGLEDHPQHLAAQVLLARYLVELERWPEAHELLDKVTAADPMHLIANKLLVRTHVATGELDEARNRLDLYALLNESDPEVEELERALDAAGHAGTPEAPAPSTAMATTTAGTGPAITTAVPADQDAQPFGDLFGATTRARSAATTRTGDVFVLTRPVATPVVQAEPAEAEPVGDEPAPATVSLGQLYLQQGHTAEAERAFTAVLERDPGDLAARAGLAAARATGEWSVHAIDLVPRETLAAPDPAERKRAVLTGYLERLRAGAPAAV